MWFNTEATLYLKNLNLVGSLGFLPAQIFDPYKALLPHLNQVVVTSIIWSSLIVDPEHRVRQRTLKANLLRALI